MQGNHYRSLRNKILASMIVVPVIPFILSMGIGFYYFSSTLQTSTINRMVRIVEDHAQMIESFLSERKSDLGFVASTYEAEELIDKETLTRVFKDLQKKSQAFVDIGVFTQEGLHIAYHGPYELEGKNYKNADWFRAVLQQDFYISDVFLGFRNIPHFIIAVVKNQNGRKWVIRATIDTSLFSDVVEKIRVGKTGEAYIVNQENLFQTTRRSGGELMEKDKDSGLPPYGFKGVKSFVGEAPGGETYLYAAQWLNNIDWLLVARQEKAEAFVNLRRLSYLVVLVAILGGVVIVTLAFNITSHIIRRMETVDTEKKALGQQLVVAGRLAEIGEMSAGFAHEINNPLQIIKSELTLTETILDDLTSQGKLDRSEDVDQIEDSLRQIRNQVDRCGGITQGLLKFARKKETQPGAIDLRRFLPDIIWLVEKKAQVEGIAITQDIPGDIPEVFGDGAHLEQVLVNLLNNALYAITEKNGSVGGEVRVSAREDAQNQVLISVSDNGTGINPENLEKIFTPFFTTKPVGKGTGLGLSICFGIITEMGGQMEVSSQVGLGTTFSIRLNKA